MAEQKISNTLVKPKDLNMIYNKLYGITKSQLEHWKKTRPFFKYWLKHVSKMSRKAIAHKRCCQEVMELKI